MQQFVAPTATASNMPSGGDGVTAGVELVPCPVSVIVCGLPWALSVKLTLPVRAPAAEGVKDTCRLHSCEGCKVPRQPLILKLKSPVLATTFEITTGPLPMLRTITGGEAIGPPTMTGPKSRLGGVI